jgi:broad specificity phosphatase PhoE
MRFDAAEFDAIYTSPAARCRETASALGIEGYRVDPRLAERHFGIFDGRSVAECKELYPREFDAFTRLDGDFVIPGGESRVQHLDRIAAWLRDVAAHANVLAFTHGGTIDFLYRLGTSRAEHGGPEVFAGPNAAISEFEVVWPEIAVVRHGVALGHGGDPVRRGARLEVR